MARGQQKIQAQQKNAEKQAKLKKQQAGGKTQKDLGQAILTITCPVCLTKIGDPKTYRQHFESKHESKKNPNTSRLVAIYCGWKVLIPNASTY